jgi:hypothetical protein
MRRRRELPNPALQRTCSSLALGSRPLNARVVIPTAGAHMQSPDEPFMEHPTGDFPDAVSAMENAITRLRALDSWERWIAFRGQGQGSAEVRVRGDEIRGAEVRVRGDEIRVDEPQVDVATVLKIGELEGDDIDIDFDGVGTFKVLRATPAQLAKFLDGLFRGPLGVRKFDDYGDYAVGAEWCDDAG